MQYFNHKDSTQTASSATIAAVPAAAPAAAPAALPVLGDASVEMLRSNL